MTEKKHSLL